MKKYGFKNIIIVFLVFTFTCFNTLSQADQKPNVRQEVLKKIQEEGLKKGLAYFHELKAQKPQKYIFDPFELNWVGYQFISKKDYKSAIRIFEENIKEYPKDANAVDSLAEAYLRKYSDTLEEGFLKKSEKLFKKALAVNPNFNTSKFQQFKIFIIRNYDKKEYMVPMRDGKKLFTQVYIPKDKGEKYPMLMTRTLYNVSPKGEQKMDYRNNLGPNTNFMREKYIFVRQDVRGKFMSEGEFLQVRPVLNQYRSRKDIDETTDTYDTIDWLVKNIPNNNGRVGMFGCSYGGFYSVLGAVNAHPALKAISPHAPVADWFVGDDWHHNGAFFMFQAVNWMRRNDFNRPKPIKNYPPRPFNVPSNNAYDFYLKMGPISNINKLFFKDRSPFWNHMFDHPDYDGFWQERNTLPHLQKIKPVVLNVGGWFDAEDLYGTLATYQAIEKQNPNARNMLIMGPWYHCDWYNIGNNIVENVRLNRGIASRCYNEKYILPFFNHHLKGKGEFVMPEALMYDTGSLGWQEFAAWPPKDSQFKNYYLAPSGCLKQDLPQKQDDFDEYISDPAKPVPHTARISARWSYHFLHEDQRFAAVRPDVLVYETPELTEGITVAGPIAVDLYVSTSRTAADWVVKVIDVFPNNTPNPRPNPNRVSMGGYQMLVRGDIMRGRYRDSLENPKPFVPGKVTRVKFVLPDIFHTFKKGHKLMVQVQSSWFPLSDRNPQTYVNIYKAKSEDFKKATHRVYHTKKYPSHIQFQVINK